MNMTGELHIDVHEVILPSKDGASVLAKHVRASAVYGTEAECRSALNDVLERYAVGHECLFRCRPDPHREVDFETGSEWWQGGVRFTALPNPGPWRDLPSVDTSMIYVGLDARPT